MNDHNFGNFSLNDWLQYQEALHPQMIDLGLARVTAVLNRLNWTKPEFVIITVTGTNGKGSCVALLEGIFHTAGYSTASYTSPHLLNYRERIRLNQCIVNEDELCAAFMHVEKARGNISLTYFEYGTLAALTLFKQHKLDVVILEVGLGGRLDATNAVDADIAVITTVDLDHMNWLGYNREAIGYEKAGIFRPQRPAVCGDPNPPLTLIDYAKQLGTVLYINGQDFSWQAAQSFEIDGGWEWQRQSKSILQKIDGLPRPIMSGIHQYQNAACALMVVNCLAARLPVTENAIYTALRTITLPGRFQVIKWQVPVILDVAHNPQAATALATMLQNHFKPAAHGRTIAVAGMLADKDIRGTLSAMLNVVDDWHFVSLTMARGAPANYLAAALIALDKNKQPQLHADVTTALNKLQSLLKIEDRIIIFGSFYTVAAALNYFAIINL